MDSSVFFFFQAEDGIRDLYVTGVQTCALPIFGLRRVYAQPFEQMLGLGSFVGGGILERHPKMKVAFLEANCSWLPWLLWRLDEGYEREGDIFMQDLTMAPSDYF